MIFRYLAIDEGTHTDNWSEIDYALDRDQAPWPREGRQNNYFFLITIYRECDSITKTCRDGLELSLLAPHPCK